MLKRELRKAKGKTILYTKHPFLIITMGQPKSYERWWKEQKRKPPKLF